MDLEPLIETCRPKGKTPPQDLRRTISAIVWRHQNGAKGRAIPAELGPWSRAAQTFIRWAHLGVWERLLRLAQERGVQLGMTFLDGTTIRAHQKAAGAARKGALQRSGIPAKPWAVRVGAMGPRRCVIADGLGARWPSSWRRAKPTNCPMQFPFWSACLACQSGWWRTGGRDALRGADLALVAVRGAAPKGDFGWRRPRHTLK